MKAASPPTRVALVGAGSIAQVHRDVLAKIPSVRLAAVVDPESSRAEALARGVADARIFADVDAMLAAERPDVAHVLVPPDRHAAVAQPLLEAGVGVLLEKPFATDPEAARTLVETARAREVPLGVNHNLRFHPSFVRLRELVRKGVLGGIDHVFSCWSVPLRQLDARQFDHFMFHSPANILYEQACHPFSQIHELLGRVVDLTVRPSGRRELTAGQIFYDTWQILLQCERGPATVLLSFGRGFPEHWVRVIGRDATVHVDFWRGQCLRLEKTRYLDFFDQFVNASSNAGRLVAAGTSHAARFVLSTLKITSRSDAFYLGMRGSIGGFHEALREKQPLPAPAEEGLAVVEACARVAAFVPAEDSAVAPAPTPTVEDGAREGEVLVTGATGFLGGHLVRRLLDEGRPVRILARRSTFLPDVLRDPRVRVMVGDVADEDAVERAVAGCQTVFHLAPGGGATWSEFERSMVGGCRHVAEACLRHEVRQLFFTSTIATYYLGDAVEGPVTERSPLDPEGDRRSFYARGKIECERLLRRMRQERHLPVTIFRPGVVLGDGGTLQHSGVGIWARDTRCIGWGLSRNPLPFVLADEVAEAMVLALGSPTAWGKSYNLVGDVRMSARDYVQALRVLTGRDYRLYPRPTWFLQSVEVAKWVVKKATRRPGAFPSWRDLKTRTLARPIENQEAKSELGWTPTGNRSLFLENAVGWVVREKLERGHPAAAPPPSTPVA